MNKKQLKEAESTENLDEIKENSSEPCEFKRVALGGRKRDLNRKNNFKKFSKTLTILTLQSPYSPQYGNISHFLYMNL